MTAATCNWDSLHDEGYFIYEVEKISRDVSSALFGSLIDSLMWRSAGFWSRMKEKGSVAKDAWGVIGSAFVFHLYRPVYTFTIYVKQV